jgi:hypothetical protein
MRYTPKTAEQIEAEERQRELENLLPKGTYDFEVFRAEDKISKSGNEMIALGLKVFADDGKTPFVNDFLLERMAFKLLHFCEVTGLTEKYESGNLTASDCVGCSGRVQIDIEPAKGAYAAKNSVRDYGDPEVSDGKPPMKGMTDKELDQDDGLEPF